MLTPITIEELGPTEKSGEIAYKFLNCDSWKCESCKANRQNGQDVFIVDDPGNPNSTDTRVSKVWCSGTVSRQKAAEFASEYKLSAAAKEAILLAGGSLAVMIVADASPYLPHCVPVPCPDAPKPSTETVYIGERFTGCNAIITTPMDT